MGFWNYLIGLGHTIETKPLKLLCTAAIMWVVAPFLIFGIWAILHLIVTHTISVPILGEIFLASAKWWIIVFLNPWKAVGEYAICFVIALFLVNYNILKASTWKDLKRVLRQ